MIDRTPRGRSSVGSNAALSPEHRKTCHRGADAQDAAGQGSAAYSRAPRHYPSRARSQTNAAVHPLPSAFDGYLDYVRYHRSLRTFRTYRPILQSFKIFCLKPHVDDVERRGLLDFATHSMKQGQKGKSIYNKVVVLSQVLKCLQELHREVTLTHCT